MHEKETYASVSHTLPQLKDVVAAAALIKIYAETMRNDRNPSVFGKSLKFLLIPLSSLLLVSPFLSILFSFIIMLLFNIYPFPLKFILQRITGVRNKPFIIIISLVAL